MPKYQAKINKRLLDVIYNKEPVPSFIIISGCLHFAEGSPYPENMIRPRLREAFNQTIPLLQRLIVEKHVQVIWMLQDSTHPENTFRAGKVDHCNEIAEQFLAGSSISVWRSAPQIADTYGDWRTEHIKPNRSDSYVDWIHRGRNTLERKTDILYNIICLA